MGIPQRVDRLQTAAIALGECGLAILDNFITPKETQGVLEAVREQSAAKLLRPARVGQEGSRTHRPDIRRDNISWINPQQCDPRFSPFLARAAALKDVINQTFFTGLWRLECHSAHYPPGAFYRRHFDAFATAERTREISMVLYMVEDWAPSDGGVLRIHQPFARDIAPRSGRLVIFQSELVEHEVTTAHRDRFSIAGWWSPRAISKTRAILNTVDGFGL